MSYGYGISLLFLVSHFDEIFTMSLLFFEEFICFILHLYRKLLRSFQEPVQCYFYM